MWLLKTEPSGYSYDRLELEKLAVWDGVTNPVAQKNLRAMKAGDAVLVYHTGNEKAVVGEAQVTKAAYPDPAAPEGKLVVVELAPRVRLNRAVTLAEIKSMPEFEQSPLVRQGRLSVVPLTETQWKAIQQRARS